MMTHSTIIARLGGPHAVARAMSEIGVDVKDVTARAWAMRSRIPSAYWPHFLTIGDASGIPITLEMLAGLAGEAAEQHAHADAA